jgi:hypothetical protein
MPPQPGGTPIEGRAAGRKTPLEPEKTGPTGACRKGSPAVLKDHPDTENRPPPVRVKARRPPSPPAAAHKIKPLTGKGLARLRKQLGLTVAQFAATLGVTPPTVYRWEGTAGKLKLQQRPLGALEAIQLKHKK